MLVVNISIVFQWNSQQLFSFISISLHFILIYNFILLILVMHFSDLEGALLLPCCVRSAWQNSDEACLQTPQCLWAEAIYSLTHLVHSQSNSNCCLPYNATVPYLAQEYTYHTFKECLYPFLTSGSSVYEHSVFFLSEWTDYHGYGPVGKRYYMI